MRNVHLIPWRTITQWTRTGISMGNLFSVSMILNLCKIWIVHDLDDAWFGLCNVWILQYLDCTRFGSLEIWILQYLDLVIFGSCNTWIVQNLDLAIFGWCNTWMVNFLDCARFRLFKIWIIGLWKIWSKLWKMCRIWISCKIWKLFILIFGSQCSVSAAELKLSCARVLLVNHKSEQY